MRRLRSCVLLLCAPLVACDCNGAAAPAKHVQSAATGQEQAQGEGRSLPQLGPAHGTPLAPERLRAFLPDSLGGFAAAKAPELQSMPLASGGVMTVVRRTYEQGPTTLKVEISDIQHAPALRKLIEAQRDAARSTEQSSFRGGQIAGSPALIQWHGPSRTALANVLLAGRILVTVKVDPADSAEPAVSAAGVLPLARLAQLGAQATAADENATADTAPNPAAKAP